MKNQIASLFGLSIQACVSNKVNVAEALANGDIRVIPRLQDIQDANEVNGGFEMVEEIDSTTRRPSLGLSASHYSVPRLPRRGKARLLSCL